MRMGIAKALDQLPRTKASAEERFRESLAMFDEGVALQRLNLRRRHLGLAEDELENMLASWLAREETR
jgi:Rv0078B-related antitoxin